MTTPTSRHLLRYAIHDTASEWLEEPSNAKVCVIPSSTAAMRPSPEYATLDRGGHQTANGEFLPSLRGIKNVDMGDLEIPLEGLSASGAGDGVDASGLDSTVWPIAEVLAGGTQASTGGLTHASDSGNGTTLEMATGEAAGFAAGDGILLQLVNTSTYVAREVVSVSTDTITLDRSLTTSAGGATTADENTAAYGARTVYFDNDSHDRTNLAFFSEYPDDDREFYGCAPSSASISLTHGDFARLRLGGLRCSDWVGNDPVTGASYSAPTTGSEIVNSPVYFWVASSLYIAWDVTVNFGLDVAPRMSQGGPNGHLGFVFRPARPTISAKISFGDLTSPAEATDTLLSTWNGSNNYSENTVDIAFQAGGSPGACLYGRMPAARVVGTPFIDSSGNRAIEVSFQASESGNHANVPGGLRLHLF